MSAEGYLNPEQFKELGALTPGEKKSISLTTAVRGGFRPLDDASMARVAHSKPFPTVSPRPFTELFEKLAPGHIPERHRKAPYN